MTDHASETAFFLPPSEEGARMALKALLVQGATRVRVTSHCAVAIDVYDAEGTLVQRALAHPDVPSPVRDAFRELVDRAITRFAASQCLDARDLARRNAADPYRGGFDAVSSNDFAGFDCGHALATANARLAKLRASLRDTSTMDIRLFAVPFLVAHIVRDGKFEQAVILRREDGEYAYESFA